MSFPTEALDPWIQQMRRAETDAGRASVLLTAPVFTLMRWKAIFRDCCRRAAFDEGVTYLDVLAETLSTQRHRGNLGGTMPMAGATTRLLGVVERAGELS